LRNLITLFVSVLFTGIADADIKKLDSGYEVSGRTMF